MSQVWYFLAPFPKVKGSKILTETNNARNKIASRIEFCPEGFPNEKRGRCIIVVNLGNMVLNA